MGLFGRSKKPPRWARALETKDRFEHFVEVVLETLADRDPPVEDWQIRSGSVLLGEIEVALDEAIEQCAEADEETWPKIIAGIADEADSDAEYNLEPERVSEHEITIGDHTIDLVDGDFADIAPFLRIQMFSPDSRGAIEAADTSAMITRDAGGDLQAVLVFDFGSVEQTVDAEHARGWGPSDDEIWDVALENLAADPLAVQSLETPGGEIVMLAGNGNFVSSLALRWSDVLARLGGPDDDESDEPVDVDAPHGVLLAVPTWHALLVHVVDPDATLGAIEPMLELVTKMFTELDDPVSGAIYWQPDPDAPLQPLDIDEDLAISDPQPLVALLADDDDD